MDNTEVRIWDWLPYSGGWSKSIFLCNRHKHIVIHNLFSEHIGITDFPCSICNNNPDILTAQEVSRLMGCSKSKVYNAIEHGELTARRCENLAWAITINDSVEWYSKCASETL